MKQRKRGLIPDELTEAMHGEFTVDEETERRHRVATARSSVALGLLTPDEAAEAYGIPLEEITASGPDPGK
ncbi:hypothetical protein SAMN00120144_3703 [Hymenobacter roseosalivarius DSM 11622]|uniref:Uncharacterized protein n=2 Tax=Hymenobacter roseosalivarius TaxID=89967 RepID=A0A1W1W1Y6_9BACT|nr:hypothetical protein SAMN00120144_3703 [Hymenobacter roseosalivarius DSM 11622]